MVFPLAALLCGLLSNQPVQKKDPPPAATKPAADNIRLTNSRLTYGEFGAVRADAKFLPGDIFFMAFDIEGIKVAPNGKVAFNMGMELVDAKGAAVFKQPPVEREEFLTLGGDRMPARAYVSLSAQQAPGPMICKMTVTDRSTGAVKTVEQKFEVVPKAFGIIGAYLSTDQEGKITAPPVGVVGQSLWVHFAAINFERDTLRKQPIVDLELIAYEKGKPILEKPLKISVDDKVNADDLILPVQLLLPLSRAGEFTIELKATDTLAKKTSKITMPLRVLGAVDR